MPCASSVDLRIDLRVRPFEVDVGQHRGPAMPRTGEVDRRRRSRLANEPVEMHVDEAQARRRSPVTEQARLDVLGTQRLAQQRVVVQIDLTDGEVIRSAPVVVKIAQRIFVELRHVVFPAVFCGNGARGTS